MLNIRKVLAFISIFALNASTLAQSEGAPTYGPFEGGGYITSHGYQDLRLADDHWYVAYQGNKDTAPSWVDAAWAARSAQLCAASGASHFVQLRYVFESVAAGDTPFANSGAGPDAPFVLRTAGPVYLPIFVPSGPRVIVPRIGPSKLAAVRCVRGTSSLIDSSRAVGVQDTLTKSREAGIITSR